MKKSLFYVLPSFFLLGCVNIHVSHNGNEVTEEKRAWAEEYATLAVEQQKKNRKIGCGFKGVKWHDSHKSHKGWALDVPKDRSEVDLEERAIILKRCELATNYANRAIEQFNENIQNDCDLQGPIWHKDKKSHFEWAENQSEDTLNMHLTLRDEMLGRCTKK